MPVPLFDEDFLHKLERLSVAARRAIPGQLQGERRSPKRGQSVEFADFRPYVPGDDFRRIDWNAYARLERFFIKLFVEEEDLTVHILVDASRSMDWGEPNKLTYALRAAGALGYVALAGLDRVTVTAINTSDGGNGRLPRSPSAYFPPHRGKAQAMSLFAFLQNISPASSPALGSAISARLRAYAAGGGPPGPVLVLSDLMDDGWTDGLHALAARGFEVTLVHILSPDEVAPTLEGDLKLLDSESDAAVEITADYDLLQHYRQGLAAWRDELQRFCAARGMHYAPLETSLPLEDLLFAWLRNRGTLK